MPLDTHTGLGLCLPHTDCDSMLTQDYHTAQAIREIFKRHHGSGTKLARRLKVTPGAVARVLQGKATSERILAAAGKYAAELKEKEDKRR